MYILLLLQQQHCACIAAPRTTPQPTHFPKGPRSAPLCLTITYNALLCLTHCLYLCTHTHPTALLCTLFLRLDGWRCSVGRKMPLFTHTHTRFDRLGNLQVNKKQTTGAAPNSINACARALPHLPAALRACRCYLLPPLTAFRCMRALCARRITTTLRARACYRTAYIAPLSKPASWRACGEKHRVVTW